MRTVDHQLSRAVEVLADITQHSLYDQNDVDKERKVIIEELKNVEDTPDDLVFEHFFTQLYNGHSIGRPVLGRRETLPHINHDELSEYRSKHYTGERAVIAAAGNLDHNRLVRMIEHRFSGNPALKRVRKPPEADEENLRQDLHTSTQQAHICWGVRAYSYNDPDKYPLLVLNTLLGGGASSRLFQQIRERHGLAYTVYSFLATYIDTGMFGIYAGTEPKQAEKALKMILKETDRLNCSPVSRHALRRAKDQLKGNMILGLENASSRMHRLAKMELYGNEWLSLDEIVNRIDAVAPDDIQQVANELFLERPNYITILWPN